MKYVLTKASDDEFIEIVDYNLEQINALAFSKNIIIRKDYNPSFVLLIKS